MLMNDKKRERTRDQEAPPPFDEQDQPLIVDGEGTGEFDAFPYEDGEANAAVETRSYQDETRPYQDEEPVIYDGEDDIPPLDEDEPPPRPTRRERERERAPAPRRAPAAGEPGKSITISVRSLTRGVGGLIAVVLVLGLLYHFVGSGFGKGRQAVSQVSATPASTVTPDATSGIPAGTTAGPLILLNPGVVTQGSKLNVMGTGFAPQASVDLVVRNPATNKALITSNVIADKNGGFLGATVVVPTSLSSGSFVVEAHEHNSTLMAKAIGTVAGGAPQVKLGAQVGKPGDSIMFSAHGFSPGETITVYWNSMGGVPVGTFEADTGGAIGQGHVQVPFGIVGTNTFLFVGSKSQSMTAAPILMLALYPSATLTNYAIRADNTVYFNGKGFGPGERVFVFLNDTTSLPIGVIQTDAHGNFAKAGGFSVPFNLKGKQTFIFMGEQSRTSSTTKFTVMPYSPHAQTSTYGGFPGTTITFYAAGFARDEVVHVYVGGQNAQSNMVSCFRADDKGNVASAGSYLVPGDVQVGKLAFSLVGAKSGSTAVATMTIEAPPSPVQVPSQPPFTCPLDANP